MPLTLSLSNYNFFATNDSCYIKKVELKNRKINIDNKAFLRECTISSFE